MGLVHELIRLTLALVLLSPSVKCGLKCQDTWELWEEHCYMFSNKNILKGVQTYYQALSTCLGQPEGAWLLQLDTPEEADFIADNIADSVILGYQCSAFLAFPDYARICVGGQDGNQPSHLLNWQTMPSESQSKGCIRFDTASLSLFAESCFDNPYHYVCEMEAADTADSVSTTIITSTSVQSTPDAELTSWVHGPSNPNTNAMTTVAESDTATTGTTTTSVEPMTPYEAQETSQTDLAAVSSSTFARLDTEGRPQAGLCLPGHVIATRRARSRVACAAACSRDARCRSFNFYKNEKRCELNSAESGPASVDLVATNECVYMRRVQ